MNRPLIAALSILAALAGNARAEPMSNDERTPATAGLISVGTPLAGVGMTLGCWSAIVDGSGGDHTGAKACVAVGIATTFAGATLGHVYAGEIWSSGLAVKLIGVGLLGVGALEATAVHQSGEVAPGAPLIVGGIATILVGSVIEMVSAPGAARRHNRRLRERAIVVPTASADGAGVALAGRF